ncbi:MAG TPA: DUF1579 family protein [Gemmatimonadales bacterium]|nr:DUF1579 family protein [Gemmatimonadales bacterium]
MRPRTQAIMLLALSCATRPLLAQGTSGAPVELSQLSNFVGNWQCTGQMFARGSRPGHATGAVGHGSKALDGHWIQFAYEERKTAANPRPYRIAGYMGYDASKKKFVQTTVDNYGSYGPSFSDGWQGDTMTFEGTGETADGKSMAVRDHFVRKGQHAFVHFSEGQGSDGKWVQPDQETCNLAASKP